MVVVAVVTDELLQKDARELTYLIGNGSDKQSCTTKDVFLRLLCQPLKLLKTIFGVSWRLSGFSFVGRFLQGGIESLFGFFPSELLADGVKNAGLNEEDAVH